jgi:hypothetical protein
MNPRRINKTGTKPGSGMTPLTRRRALGWIAAAPAAAALAPGALAVEEIKTGFQNIDDVGSVSSSGKGSPDIECVLKGEKELTRKERARLRKNAPGVEGALRTLREFDLPGDVEPAINFRATRSVRGGRE